MKLFIPLSIVLYFSLLSILTLPSLFNLLALCYLLSCQIRCFPGFNDDWPCIPILPQEDVSVLTSYLTECLLPTFLSPALTAMAYFHHHLKPSVKSQTHLFLPKWVLLFWLSTISLSVSQSPRPPGHLAWHMASSFCLTSCTTRH